MAKIKAVIRTGIPEKKRKHRDRLGSPDAVGGGMFQDKILESHPNYNTAASEQVIEGENNTYIVLGRDRPAGFSSGYGGKGDTHAGRIDIIAGMQGMNAAEENANGETLFTDPCMFRDAARIYISQKTDVDESFKIHTGRIGEAKTKSAIALKADGVRIIGREGIKLVTGTDKFNSQGVKIQGISGIDLIAGNLGDELEPIPRGKKLTSALEDMVKLVSSLSDIVTNLTTNQAKLITALSTHTHMMTPVGIASPSPDFAPSATLRLVETATIIGKLAAYKANCATHKMNHYNPIGKRYINSRYNSTN